MSMHMLKIVKSSLLMVKQSVPESYDSAFKHISPALCEPAALILSVNSQTHFLVHTLRGIPHTVFLTCV